MNLKSQIQQFHYSIESLAHVEIEPMGLYSKTALSLKELKPRSRIALPNDPINERRALLLLQEKGLIRLEGKEYIVKDGDVCVFRFSV